MTYVAAIVGPTAVGKTQASLEVAERIDAEIVSLDSMQLYRGMDIGTDKATPEMRERVPHHLIDVVEPSHDVTVEGFQRLARSAIEDVSSRGRVPLLVGGAGLYLRAVVDDLRFPPTSPQVRASLESEVEELGAEALHARLAELDPAAAAKIEPRNVRRTVRALEVIEVTGELFSARDAWSRYEGIYELRIAGLERPADDLYARIEQRAERLVDAGLVDETRRVTEAGMSRTARQALGYRQVLEAAEDISREALVGEIARATKRFARRQRSWFRTDPRVRWFDATDPELVERLVAFLQPSGGTVGV